MLDKTNFPYLLELLFQYLPLQDIKSVRLVSKYIYIRTTRYMHRVCWMNYCIESADSYPSDHFAMARWKSGPVPVTRKLLLYNAKQITPNTKGLWIVRGYCNKPIPKIGPLKTLIVNQSNMHIYTGVHTHTLVIKNVTRDIHIAANHFVGVKIIYIDYGYNPCVTSLVLEKYVQQVFCEKTFLKTNHEPDIHSCVAIMPLCGPDPVPLNNRKRKLEDNIPHAIMNNNSRPTKIPRIFKNTKALIIEDTKDLPNWEFPNLVYLKSPLNNIPHLRGKVPGVKYLMVKTFKRWQLELQGLRRLHCGSSNVNNLTSLKRLELFSCEFYTHKKIKTGDLDLLRLFKCNGEIEVQGGWIRTITLRGVTKLNLNCKFAYLDVVFNNSVKSIPTLNYHSLHCSGATVTTSNHPNLTRVTCKELIIDSPNKLRHVSLEKCQCSHPNYMNGIIDVFLTSNISNYINLFPNVRKVVVSKYVIHTQDQIDQFIKIHPELVIIQATIDMNAEPN
jgi:hypothetical protein